MKIRIGFVSNSSTTSFSIYGWNSCDLVQHFLGDNPLFKGCRLEFDAWGDRTILDNLEELYDGPEYEIDACKDEDGDWIIGVGRSGDECDHGCDPLFDGHYFPAPEEEKIKRIDAMAKKLNLPQPKLFKGTYRD